MSDQVREPTAQATVDTAVEIAGAMESPAHGATAEGELTLDSGLLIDLDTEILFTQPSSELSDWQYIPPNLPLPPPLKDLFPFSTPSSLDFVSLSAHPQLTICGVGSPLVCPSPAPLTLSLEDPSTPQEPVSPPTPPGSQSLWLSLGQSSPYLHLGTASPPALLRPSVPLAPLGSFFPPAPPQSSVAPAPPQPSGSPPTPQSPKPPAPPWPSGSSASSWLFGSLSLPRAPPPPAPPPLVGPL